ncbi:beta-catenin-interacting protein 1 isoform 2-T2 [Guaruba guarouba]
MWWFRKKPPNSKNNRHWRQDRVWLILIHFTRQCNIVMSRGLSMNFDWHKRADRPEWAKLRSVNRAVSSFFPAGIINQD